MWAFELGVASGFFEFVRMKFFLSHNSCKKWLQCVELSKWTVVQLRKFGVMLNSKNNRKQFDSEIMGRECKTVKWNGESLEPSLQRSFC